MFISTSLHKQSICMDLTKAWYGIRYYSKSQIKPFYNTIKTYLATYNVPLLGWSAISSDTTADQLCELNSNNINNVFPRIKNAIYIFLSGNQMKFFNNYAIVHGTIEHFRMARDGFGIFGQQKQEVGPFP